MDECTLRAALRLERMAAEHWKSNHADVTMRCALLMQRPDLPVDRIPVYMELERLQERVRELEGGLREWVTVPLSESKMFREQRAEIHQLRNALVESRANHRRDMTDLMKIAGTLCGLSETQIRQIQRDSAAGRGLIPTRESLTPSNPAEWGISAQKLSGTWEVPATDGVSA